MNLSPTNAQMRALQHLRDGRLIIRTTGHDFLNDVSIEGVGDRVSGVGYLCAERTAKILIENGWVTLAKFNPRRGEYRLTDAGRAVTNLLCDCRRQTAAGRSPKRNVRVEDVVLLSGIDPEASTPNRDWPNERLLCRRCWRRMACAGKFFKHLHGANRLSSLGPICQKHFLKPEARG